MADNNIGISLIIKAVDAGSPILEKISGALDKIGLSSTNAGQKAGTAGNQIKNAFSAIPDHLDKMNKAVESFSNKLASMGASLTALGASITAPMGLAVKTAADFENEMNKLQAFGEIDVKTDAGQKAFKALSDKARELGAATQFTAAEVAAGMGELAKAGYSTEQIIASIGPALNLAFTEGRSMKDTAEDLVKVLASFGMGADQAGRATDVLSKTSLATTTSMSGLVEGLKYVASMANNVGMNIEETSAYLGIFAQNGVDASMAGTGLRRILGDLSNPTKEARGALANLGVEIAKNSDGSVNLTKTFERLAKSGLSTADAFKIFGDQGGNVAITASKNIDAIKKLTVENENAKGSLDKVVGIINKGLGPAWKNFLSALQEVAIALAGPFLEALKGALDQVSAFLRGVSEFSKAHPIITQAITAIVASFGLFAAAAGTISLSIAGVGYALGGLGTVFAGSGILSIGSTVASLIPSWAGLTAAIGSFVSALGTAGTAIAAFASGPVAIIAAAVAAIVGAVAGGYKILSDRAEAAAIQAETLKKSQDDLQRAIDEGFDPKAAIKRVSGADLQNDPYVDLVAKRKQAVAEFVGIGEQLTQAREKDAQSWLPGKSSDTKAAERNFVLARQNLDAIQAEINGRIDQKAAVEGLVVAHEKLVNAQKQEVKTSEELLQLTKNRSEVELKLIGDSFKDKENAFKLELDQRKVAIEESTKSTVLTEQQINNLITSSSQQRIRIAEAEYAATRAAREKSFSEQRSIYENMLKSGEDVASAKKGLAELEKAQTEAQIADQRRLSEAVMQEAHTQLNAKSDAIKKIKDLEKELQSEQDSTQEALKGISGAYLNEYGKIETKLFDINEKFKQATKLIPTMPEKALELFKQVKSESAGMVNNLEQFNDKLQKVANNTQDALRRVNRFGEEGADKYKQAAGDARWLAERANQAIAGGKFQTAEGLFNTLMATAESLPSAVKKTGDAEVDKRNLEDAKQTARDYIALASGGLTDVINLQKLQAEKTNEQAKKNLEAAQKQIEDLIKSQIQSSKNLITALNENTAALRGTSGNNQQGGQDGPGQGGESDLPPNYTPSDYTPRYDTGSTNLGYDYGFGGSLGGGLGGYDGSMSGMTKYAVNSPEVGRLLAQTDKLLAKSHAESQTMAARMDALRYLESAAKNLDYKERMGYFGTLGPQDAADPEFGMGDKDISDALYRILGRDTFDFDAMRGNIDRMLGGAYERAKTTVDGAKEALDPQTQLNNQIGDMTQRLETVFDNFSNKFESVMDDAGGRFASTTERSIEDAFGKGMLMEVNLSNDDGASLGSVRRII
ncbi:phage tail tape measure protein [Desulfomonile tiedjei]|uniref:Phage tail tape measure protein, TP901 family n=1 Tax=Desulfomonile tiedjei (strain ATCC 49306 / DSM 6799 / DCB-1) TaxID=706587 RepID=I4C5Y9_DESTA|nr:phage tail tape measure protein [Desulfomonile tiedjei]AFM24980.1 phage tail tape measure protein, TP901 family [Desulfomonile tiedjei DSM 6799]